MVQSLALLHHRCLSTWANSQTLSSDSRETGSQTSAAPLLLQIASGSVICLNATCDEDARQLASLDLEQLKVHIQLSSETAHAEVTVQEITVQDLGSCPASSADVVLTRWQQSGKQGDPTHLQLSTASHFSLSCDACHYETPRPDMGDAVPVTRYEFAACCLAHAPC